MNAVIIRLGDLRDAASKYGRLSVPKGVRGTIPRTTEIKPSPDAEGRWESVVSVECKLLHKTLDDLKRRWADIGGDNAKATLSSTATSLDISWSDGKASRRVSLPAWPPRV